MAEVHAQRLAAQIEGDFVVFIIGVRINKLWKIHKWLPATQAMSRMMKELSRNPESGFLGHEQFMSTTIQYWRSFDHLERYARDHNQEHWPAWVAFNKRVSQSRGDVGIWHETYRVAAGQYEALYSGMPTFGLGKAGRLVPATGALESARGRMAPAATSPA